MPKYLDTMYSNLGKLDFMASNTTVGGTEIPIRELQGHFNLHSLIKTICFKFAHRLPKKKKKKKKKHRNLHKVVPSLRHVYLCLETSGHPLDGRRTITS